MGMSIGGISGSAPISNESDSGAMKATKLVADFNTEINRVIGILPKWVNISDQTRDELVGSLIGVLNTVNSKTPGQLAAIPGFLSGMQALVNSFRAAENQCDAQIKATGVDDFRAYPLSNQIDPVTGKFTANSQHGVLLTNAMNLTALLS